MSKCKVSCNMCDLPLDSDVELRKYLENNIVTCNICNNRLIGALIPCDKHGCNKNYCLDCTMPSDIQCDYCLRLACCDKTLNIVKFGKMTEFGKVMDRHCCEDSVKWLQKKKK